MLMANAPAANLGLGAAAAVHALVSACGKLRRTRRSRSPSDQIQLGRADMAVVGGTEGVIHPLPLNAFAQSAGPQPSQRRPERASRPWDTDRDGFVLGEGSVIMRDRDVGVGAGPWGEDLRDARRRRDQQRQPRHRPA